MPYRQIPTLPPGAHPARRSRRPALSALAPPWRRPQPQLHKRPCPRTKNRKKSGVHTPAATGPFRGGLRAEPAGTECAHKARSQTTATWGGAAAPDARRRRPSRQGRPNSMRMRKQRAPSTAGCVPIAAPAAPGAPPVEGPGKNRCTAGKRHKRSGRALGSPGAAPGRGELTPQHRKA